MGNPFDKPGGRIILGTVLMTLASALVLAGIALIADPDTGEHIFSEQGPFEVASAWLWVLLAVTLPIMIRPPTPGVVAGTIICLFAAAREADWHKSLTGYSVLKPGFYLKEAHPIDQRLIAGILVSLLAASGVVLLYRLARPLRPSRRPWPVWWLGALFVVLVVAGSKLLDRLPAILREDFGMDMHPLALSVGMALEEGLEFLTPLIVLGVVLSFIASRRAGVNAGPRPEATDPDNR